MSEVIGIGSALLDFTYEVDDVILKDLGLKKGTMSLITESGSEKILQKMKEYPVKVSPGGSAANTMAGIAVLGGNGAFIGKVGNDINGKIYIAETEKFGVKAHINSTNAMTGHAITFITPDSERTFATNLGAALSLRPDDVSEEAISKSSILHVEGYLLEGDLKDASVHAMELAKKHNVKISVDLADPSLIARNLGEFKGIVRNYADIVFVNEDEAEAFTQKTGHEALDFIHLFCEVAVVKLGAGGSLIKQGDRVHTIEPVKIKVVNTNGAGDMYAAGILYGIAHDIPMERAGKIASYAAAQVVGQAEARLNERIDVNSI
ncbi:MAG TPA: adenosine kinase [Spirochaetota bacterium]|nr:adenosine kinase [Spirochaetota bacterium]HPJ37454.1 adenosine kinase [Spirochaetota bacterium]HPQ51997.1 adenosine kinase [Spirochaetota bacterium]